MRAFISIDLRQWPTRKCEIVLHDLDGNVCVLDGLIHGAPHTHALVEVEIDENGKADIEIPGHLCDYHMDNGKEKAERKPHPLPRVKLDAKGNLRIAETNEFAEVDSQNRLIGKKPLPPQDMNGPPGVEA